MDPELQKTLEEIHALTKDNHRMLRAIRRDQILSFFGKIVLWVVVLALPLYLYQQYLEPLTAKFSTTPGSVSSLFGLPTSADFQKMINSYKVGQ